MAYDSVVLKLRLLRLLPSLFLFFLFLTAMLFFGLSEPSEPAAVEAKENNSEEGKDGLDPSTFAFLEEETEGGESNIIQAKGYNRVIDKESRLLQVRFNKKSLEGEVNLAEMRRKWQEVAQSQKYQGANESERDKIAEIFLVGSVGYEVSVSAFFHPKKGEPFPLKVERYATVATVKEIIKSDFRGKSRGESIIEPPLYIRERRLYRLDVREGELALTDEIKDGSIELPENLAEGDQVKVAIINYAIDGMRSQTWVLEVKDIGFQTKIDNTTLFIRRLNNPSDKDEKDEKKLKELKSNFKPESGGSLLLKYSSRNHAWNFVDLSIGVNASFVDFHKDENLEIGVGPVLGVIGSALQFGFGWNLMVDSNRFYVSIGIGFISLSDKVKEVKKAKEVDSRQ